MATVDEAGLGSLAGSFTGELLRPSDASYDEARRLYNGLIDKRPALIARCRSAADVVAALGFARERGFEISVRGGGHGVAGRALADGGVTIDLSSMKEVRVDAGARTAQAQAGVTWGEFNDATAAYGLATTGGIISTTGIAGLTLGGGLGWLMGKLGLTVDNVHSIELVTADGDVLHVSAEDHPDLFWALRGAGANFGVATTFEYRLHPLSQIAGGLVAHPFSAAKDVLRFYRDFTSDVPDDLTIFAGLVHAPDGSGVPLAALVVCHAGDPAQAEIDLKPLMDFGSAAVTQVGPMPYPAVNMMLDAGYPIGSLNYWKTSFIEELTDDAIDTMIEVFRDCPSPMTGILMENFHGAVTRVGVSDTAVPHRQTGYNTLIPSVWMDPETTDENVEWTRRAYSALRPHMVGRRYVNYLDADDMSESAGAAYGPNYERLALLKRQYDPDNVFRSNLNIEPAS